MLKNRLVLGYIIIFAIIIRIAAGYVLGSPKTWECEEITDNILAGKGFVLESGHSKYFAIIEPLYPYLTSLVYLASGHRHLAMVFVQICVSALLIFILYLIGKTTFGLMTGLIAAFIVAIHPAFVYYDVKNLHPLSLAAMFFALSAWLMVLFKKNPSFKTASLAGFASGLGTLARGTVGSFFILGILWSYYQLRKDKKIYRLLFIMIACFVIAIFPWTLRNYILLKKIVPIRAGLYGLFWSGNNENATGTGFFDRSGRSIAEIASPELQKKFYEVESDDHFFRNEAFKFIKSNRMKFLNLTLKKFLYFWWFSPQTGTLYPTAYTIIYKGFYLIFLSLFLSGMYFSLKNKELRTYAYLFLLLFLAVSATHALTYVDCRHRWGIEPLMALFAAFSLSKIKVKFSFSNGRLKCRL